MGMGDRWRIKLQKLNKWFSQLARNCLVRNNLWRELRVEHMTRRWRVVSGWIFRDYLTGKANPRNSLFGKKLCFVLPSLYPHYIYHNYPQSVRSVFHKENPRKYTWELKIVIPTIIYTFPCGFPQLLPLHL